MTQKAADNLFNCSSAQAHFCEAETPSLDLPL